MIQKMFFGLCAVVALAMGAAAQTVVVTPTNYAAEGWSTADTRPGGSSAIIADNTAPQGGNGALQLTTDATTTSKAQFMHAANVPLSQVSALSYWTKQNAPAGNVADASYQLPVCLGGIVAPSTTYPNGCVGFTTLVFEPYQADGTATHSTVVNGQWQYWDAFSGYWWSSRSYSESAGCTVKAGGGGRYFYQVSQLAAACPNAVVTGFGVNIGSNNPGFNVEADLLTFNSTTYDFEPYVVAKTQDQCKNNGWKSVFRNDGSTFKNQGDCIQYVNTGK